MEEVNTKKLTEFFLTNCPPDEEPWEILTTGSRCEGFNLAYGSFCALSDIPGYENITDNELDDLIEKLSNKYPDLQFYKLPCCYPDETGYNLFVGFNVYPLLWTKRRYFVDNRCLLSAHDDSIVTNKKKLLDKLSKYPRYDLPYFLREIADILYDGYRSFKWKNTLFLDNYNDMDVLKKVLDNVYAQKIKNFNVDIELVDKIYKPNNKYQWCLLPTDCASCS